MRGSHSSSCATRSAPAIRPDFRSRRLSVGEFFPRSTENFRVDSGRGCSLDRVLAGESVEAALARALLWDRRTMDVSVLAIRSRESTAPNRWPLVSLMVLAIVVDHRPRLVGRSARGGRRAPRSGGRADGARVEPRGHPSSAPRDRRARCVSHRGARLGGSGRCLPAFGGPARSGAGLAPADPSRFILSVPLASERRVDLGVTAAQLLGVEAGPHRVDDPIDRAGEPTVFLARLGGGPLRDGRAGPRVGAAARGARPQRACDEALAPEAAQLGLPARTAMAGLARVDAGRLGAWAVAAVATRRASGTARRGPSGGSCSASIVASGLVLVFGGWPSASSARSSSSPRELAVAEVQRAGDEALAHAQRVADDGHLCDGHRSRGLDAPRA